jgi:predicted RNA-binding protein
LAKKNLSVTFKNAQIDLEEGTITEFLKEEVKTYRLLDELRKFAGQDKRVDITIKETSDLEPTEE